MHTPIFQHHILADLPAGRQVLSLLRLPTCPPLEGSATWARGSNITSIGQSVQNPADIFFLKIIHFKIIKGALIQARQGFRAKVAFHFSF